MCVKLLRSVCLSALAASACTTALATPETQDGVVISVTRTERKTFDVPVSVDVITSSTLRDGQPKVNLSEALGSVPGLLIQNRNNYAQDLQLSIRGFGARASFGIRGVKLYADGIPATMPDGQGQAASFNLSSAERIEVMRGPFSSLYGNSAGGVVQVFTERGPMQPTLDAELLSGAWDTQRLGVKASGTSNGINYVADWSQFHTNGWRSHSSVTREQLNSTLRWQVGVDTRATLVFNMLDQPDTQDPLGLTRAQYSADPRQATSVASTYNTRKSIRQNQSGLTIEQRLSASDSVRIAGYFGDRTLQQYLSQTGDNAGTSIGAGGVVDLDRWFGGANITWLHEGTLAERPFNTTVGAEQEIQQERRRGYVNNSGTAGSLRRDENDRVSARNYFAQSDWRFADRWSMSAGVRYSRVAFNVQDNYITTSSPANPDDSGALRYTNTSPVAGLSYRLAPEVAVYASAGRGFETPTFSEIAYSSSSGPNFTLAAARSTNAEIGLKGRTDLHRFTLARFSTTTRNEIVVDSSVSGRTYYKNASRTQRDGWEAAWNAALPANLDTTLAYTTLKATYAESFTSSTSTIAAGNVLPGVPASTLYAEVRWKHARSGFSTALEARRNAKIYVNDANSDAAEAYSVGNVRAGFEQAGPGWKMSQTLRIDNVANRRYIGSVIVADSNSRFFESALPRSISLMLSARSTF